MTDWQSKIYRFISSPRFFVAILTLFILQAVWLVFTAAYPMAFDENTHWGITQLHARQWSPLFLEQPPDSGFAGALTRDPSYLYHYLFSFPYRLITAVTDSFMAQITALRLINVAIFVAALLLFRQLLLRVRVSSVLTNITLLFFVLIPVVPYLAAQINYDNLIMLAAAGALLLALSINEKLDRRKLPVGLILWLLTLCLFASLVQFIFLPIFAAIVLWFGWRIWRGSFSPLKGLRTAWRVNSWRGRLLVGLPLLIAIGLFTHMYGYNLVAYRTPIPQCNEVLSERQCAEHGPWVRNHQALLTKTEVNPNPALYAGGWLYRMFVSLFYTSSGGASPQAWYLSVNPLPVAFGIALLVFGAGLVFVARYGRHVLSDHRQLGFLLFVGLVYITALWLRNYHSYLHFGQKLAINGRYLLPVILPLMALMALSYRQALAGFPRLRIVIAGAVLLLVMQGGGIINYLVVSNKYWYWPNRAVIKVNQAAQRVVKPLVIIEMPLKSVDQYL